MLNQLHGGGTGALEALANVLLHVGLHRQLPAGFLLTADAVFVDDPHGQGLEDILDEPPDDAVDPDPEGQELVVTKSKTHDREAIQEALGPHASKNGRDGKRDCGGDEEDGRGLDLEEQLALGACAEEREEIGERNL